MKLLSDALLAAQKGLSQRPYIRWLTATSRRWGVQPLAYAPLQGVPPTGEQFAACLAADGSLVRMRINAAGDVMVQRVPDPYTTAGWPLWTTVAAGVASHLAPPSMAAGPTLVNMCYVRRDGVTVVRRFSGSSGATWSGESIVASDAAAPVRAVAMETRIGTDERLFLWAAGPSAAGSPVVELRTRTLSATGVYGAVAASTLPKFWQVEGLSCSHDGDWAVAVAGQSGEGDHPWGVFLATLGDGYAVPVGAWMPLATLQRADSLTEYRYDHPSLLAVAGTYRCAYWARRPGGPNRLEVAHRPGAGFAPERWTAPAPALPVDAPALLVPGRGGDALLAGSMGAWAVGATARSVELAGRLRSYTYHSPGALRFVLFAPAGADADLDVLRPGAGIRLSRGLHTPGGPLGVSLPEQEVAEVRRAVGAGERLLVVECRDALSALGAYRANRSFGWDRTRAADAILGELCALAGVRLTVAGAPSALASRRPSFALDPGESVLAAARRLLDLMPERLRPDGDSLALADPDAPATPYLYGHGGHPLLGYGLASRLLEPNHVQAYGKRGTGIYGEALDADAVARLGQRLAKVVDLSLGNSVEAAELARAVLAAARRRAAGGELSSMPNLGIELWDRVELRTNPTGPAEGRTVAAFEERYDPARGEWRQTVAFGED